MNFILLICAIAGILFSAYRKRWTPKTVLLALAGTGTAFGLISLMAGMGQSRAPDLNTLLQPERAAAYRLGQAVRTQIPAGGTVLLFQDELPDPEPMMQEQPAVRAEGLRDALGEAYTVLRVNTLQREETEFNPETGMWILQVSDYAALIRKYGPADAVVTFSGLPRDLHNLNSLGVPFFGYIQDPPPPEWTSALPEGLSALVSPRPGILPSDLSTGPSVREFAETVFTLTPALP